MSFEYFLLPDISFMDFVCCIPLFLLYFSSGYLHPKPEIQLIFFLQVTHESVSAHHACHFLPHMKGHAYFPDVLETHPCIFSPHFLFPDLCQ